MPDDTTLIAPSDSLENGRKKYSSKTSAVFVLHKDTVVLNFFMKTVEDQNAPGYQTVISQLHYLSVPGGFSGEILYFTLGRQFINGYLWKGGAITKSVSLSTVVVPPSPQAQSYKGKLKADNMEPINCVTTVYEIMQVTTVTYGNNPPVTTVEPSGQTFSETTCDWIDTGGDTGSGSGGVSGGTGTTPSPSPCSPASNPVESSVKSGRLVINYVPVAGGGSGSGGGTGGSTPCTTNPPTQQQVTIDKLMKNANSLTSDQKATLQALLNTILQDCIGQATIGYLLSNNDTFNFQMNPTISGQASYNPATGAIDLNNVTTLSAANLEEEFFHAYQNFNYPNGTTQYAGKAGPANIEFEAKVLKDITWNMDMYNGNGTGGAWTLSDPAYISWIKSITNNFTQYPTSFTPTQLTQYFNFIPEFLQQNPGYSGDTENSNLNPTAMFSLINSSSCASN
jgi:hypothetical protein